MSRDKLGRIGRIEQSGTAIQLKDKRHHHEGFSSAHDFKYDASGRRLYKQTSDPSMISFHLAGGLNMIVTDPLGNRSGYGSDVGPLIGAFETLRLNY